jgi:hypothetical protein
MDYADTGSGESSYIGSFINGVRHGEGRCFFHKTGEVYEGEWSCDEPIGIKIFQHDGPLVGEGASGELESVEPSLRPPIDQPRRCSNTSMGSFYNESSLDEVKWSLSGIDNVITDNGPQTTSSFRRSQSTSSDNLSQTIKALSIIDNFEVHIKRYQYQNGDVFEGCLDEVSGLRQGSGFYTEHRMGSSYDGDWKHGKRHGTGHLRLASGVEYSGEFYDDKIHGQGRLILINGSEYMVRVVCLHFVVIWNVDMACLLISVLKPIFCRVHSSTACSMVMVCSRIMYITECILESSRTVRGLVTVRRRSRMVPGSRAHTSKGSEMDSASFMVPTTL